MKTWESPFSDRYNYGILYPMGVISSKTRGTKEHYMQVARRLSERFDRETGMEMLTAPEELLAWLRAR
ncbi:hypothetical protein, partial [Thiolapillus sp.]